MCVLFLINNDAIFQNQDNCVVGNNNVECVSNKRIISGHCTLLCLNDNSIQRSDEVITNDGASFEQGKLCRGTNCSTIVNINMGR